MTIALTACASGPEHPAVSPLAQISVEEGLTEAPNGVDELAPAEVLQRSLAAMRATGSYRVTGTTVGGNTIDIAFKDGVGSVGTVGSDTTVQLVATPGAVFVTGDPESLATYVGADVDTTLAGKWLLISPEAASSFAIFADGSTFAAAVLGADDPEGLTAVREVDGVPAVGLLFPQTGGTLWVAATGEPLPLRLEEKGASAGAGVITFSDYGTEVAVTPPAEDAVVDLTKIPVPGATPTPTP
ncbi:hypothetical protein E1262_14030 [Jiangella aurantiaca]|uniref:LppX_LprAFG lipoprotein n=1 Tax=Jiangella aurantiaca TaxID=2530373 RepID=A0A4R5ABR9_9ACTN|nr:hypothetical protein [Jiangella aurantiaca]TDD69135.1 hypothetical protein E1262_14030 [Jiangella aurantiaca]